MEEQTIPPRPVGGPRGPGWVDAAARLSARLLGFARFRDDLRTVLGQIDPDSAPALIKTVLLTDTGLTLDLVNALPRMANVLIEGLRELVDQVQRLPKALVAELIATNLAQLRRETLGRSVGKLVALGLTLEREGLAKETLCDDFMTGFRAEVEPAALRAAVTRFLERNPGLTEDLLVPLLTPITEALQARDAGREEEGRP